MATFSNLSSLGGDHVEKGDDRLQGTGLQAEVSEFMLSRAPVENSASTSGKDVQSAMACAH